MKLETAKLLREKLPVEAIVLDVVGGALPFPRDEWVIDALACDTCLIGPLGSWPRAFWA